MADRRQATNELKQTLEILGARVKALEIRVEGLEAREEERHPEVQDVDDESDNDPGPNFEKEISDLEGPELPSEED